MKRKVCFLLVLFPIVFLLSSCVTIMTDVLTTMFTGKSSANIERRMKTLDPTSSYSKRSALFLSILEDDALMQKLEESFPDIVDSVLNEDRPNIENVVIKYDDVEINSYLVFPRDYSKLRTYPVILYSHGGGFIAWDFTKFKSFVGSIADATQSCVLFYEYRLAPEFKFPCAVNDTFEVYKWLLDDENVKDYNIDNKNVLFMGDSSGGNLVAGLSIRLAENKMPNAKGLCLLYPSLDVSDNLNFSRIAFSGLEEPKRYYVTSMEYLSGVKNAYLEKSEDAYLPYASPLIMLEGLIEVEGFANPFEKYKTSLTPPLPLPPHFICVADVDALRDEGKTYYALLKIFGVEAKAKVYKGMFHGFAMMGAGIYKAEECMNDCFEFINSTLNAEEI